MQFLNEAEEYSWFVMLVESIWKCWDEHQTVLVQVLR